MAYTSYVESPKANFGSPYERLEFALTYGAESGKDMYVLRIPKKHAARVQTQKDLRIVEMPSCIDIVVHGAFSDAERIAKQVHQLTGEIVGGTRVRDPQLTSIVQADAEYARQIAQEKKLPYFIQK